MINVARVTLWDLMVGAVAWNDRRGCAAFEFDEGFLKRGWDIAPLTMQIERAAAGTRTFSFPQLSKETYKGLPGLLADSLPDNFGNALIDAWLAREGKDAASFMPIDRLCYTGKRGMGALEFKPAIPGSDSASNPVEVDKLVALAKKVLSEKAQWKANLHKDADKGLLELIRMGTSAGGARPKAVIAYNEQTGEVRSGQVDDLDGFEYWILKFDGVTNKALGDPKGYGRIEYAYQLMATACGIQMAPCRLLREHGRAHFMAKRFDRVGSRKVHMQTLCAMAHYDYTMPGAYSYEQAFQVMRQLRVPHEGMEQLYRRMVFNVVARNQDDHTKNISFLMDEEGRWNLAPAYDMTYACKPGNKWLMAHQMTINGKREGFAKSDLLAMAKSVNIKKPAEIVEQVIDTVSGWTGYAKEATVGAEQIREIRKTLLLKW